MRCPSSPIPPAGGVPHIPAASAATYPLRCFAPQWARFDNRPTSGGGFKRRGPKPPPLSLQGDRILKERGKFEIPLSLSGVLWLLSFDMRRKQLAPAGATPAYPRAKGPLDRRSKRLSFPHFFLRRKKCGRRRPPPRQGKIDSPPQRRNPPRAKGSLNRRFEWFSLVTFFLQKKKVTRAGARNAPSRARRRNTCSPPGQRPPRKRKKRDGLRRLFLYLISCPCGSATPAPAPARISASCSPPPACRSGCPARSTSRTQTWPR